MSTQNTTVDAVTAFMVILNNDGGLDVHTTKMPTVNVTRVADVADIEAAALRLAAEAGRILMQQALQGAPEPSPSAVVAEALAKRAQE